MEKRIITWTTPGSSSKQTDGTWKQISKGSVVSRGFIFGGYAESFLDYKKLVDQVVQDFPTIELKDIKLSKITESSYMKYFIVVSFPLPPKAKKKGYDQWTRFDFNY